jgi:DNA-3-methyladenine glycosylase
MSSTPAEVGRPLSRDFFARATVELAQALLGMLVVREGEGWQAVGRIVETEAYRGPQDQASHARAGLTPRTAPMFGQVGHAYVYLVYGMHSCLNVVGYAGQPAGAVLIRALEPVAGVSQMQLRRNRPHEAVARLCAGPAKLCQALDVDRRFDGHDLTRPGELWLAAPGDRTAPAAQAEEIASGPRIGVDYAGSDWAARPWRFWLAGNPSVSR